MCVRSEKLRDKLLTSRVPTVDTREIMPLDEAQIRNECQTIREKGIDDIAIVGVFSPLDTEGIQEVRVRDIVQEEIPGADVVCSRNSQCTTTTPRSRADAQQLASLDIWKEKMPQF